MNNLEGEVIFYVKKNFYSIDENCIDEICVRSFSQFDFVKITSSRQFVHNNEDIA